MAIIMGQHVRVGIEDNLWNSKRERMTTVEQIKAAVELCERFGRKVATAEEAREIMKIGVRYNSVDETLKNLGMPPNRGDDDRGFMVWETDGKKSVAASDVRFASHGLLHDAATGSGDEMRSGQARSLPSESRADPVSPS